MASTRKSFRAIFLGFICKTLCNKNALLLALAILKIIMCIISSRHYPPTSPLIFQYQAGVIPPEEKDPTRHIKPGYLSRRIFLSCGALCLVSLEAWDHPEVALWGSLRRRHAARREKTFVPRTKKRRETSHTKPGEGKRSKGELLLEAHLLRQRTRRVM